MMKYSKAMLRTLLVASIIVISQGDKKGEAINTVHVLSHLADLMPTPLIITAM